MDESTSKQHLLAIGVYDFIALDCVSCDACDIKVNNWRAVRSGIFRFTMVWCGIPREITQYIPEIQKQASVTNNNKRERFIFYMRKQRKIWYTKVL